MCCSHSFNCTMLRDVCIVCIWVALPNSIELCSAVCTHMYMCCSPTFNEAMLYDVCTFVYRLYPHSIGAMPINVCSVCICDFLPAWSSFMVHGLYECICAVHLHSMKPCHAMRMCVYVMFSHLFKLYCATCVCMHTCCSPTFNQAVPCTGCMYIYIHVLLSCGQLSHAVWLVYVCTHVVLLHLIELCCAICFGCVTVLFFCLQLSHAMWCVYVCIFAILLHLTKLCCWMCALYAHVLF